MKIALRCAVMADIPRLEALIADSVRGLQAGDYTPEQIERAIKTVYTIDTQLVADGTFFAAEARDDRAMAGCGGWSKRRKLLGGDRFATRGSDLLDPATDAAKIRAFFVHPDWARRGIGSMILEACESAAVAVGFTRFELGATLTGVPFYRARGYKEVERIEAAVGQGVSIEGYRMEKRLT